MKIITDFQGLAVRLTDERLAHILEHPEMATMEDAIEETLAHPERVVQSASDEQLTCRTGFTTVRWWATNTCASWSRSQREMPL